MSPNSILLSVNGLSVSFNTVDGVAQPVRDISFSVKKGRTFALVGESGCGKTVTALSIMRLVPPPGKITGGEVVFENKDLLKVTNRQMRSIRGKRIAMIFQEPTASLNPVYPVGEQIAEAVMLHHRKSATEAWSDAVDMLGKVGVGSPAERAYNYPHQFSGGMCQRAMIAMAVSCGPELLIADEPTTALDVTIQAQILDLLDELQARNQMSILLITHDLSVASQCADDVGVMYASRIVETADCQTLFSEPLHPYTKGLLQSAPRPGYSGRRLQTIGGAVPEPLRFPTGCKFHPRCSLGCNNSRCKSVEPTLKEVRPGRFVACWNVEGN